MPSYELNIYHSLNFSGGGRRCIRFVKRNVWVTSMIVLFSKLNLFNVKVFDMLEALSLM